MRPRSRLLAKRCLQLPTIAEAYEDMVKDMNQSSTLHYTSLQSHPHTLSSEDYLLSICQLACPTFPAHGSSSSCDIINMRQQDFLQQRARLLKSVTQDECHSASEPYYREEALVKDVGDVTKGQQISCHGAPDPLEFLFGHCNNSAPFTCELGGIRRRSANGRGGRSQGEWSEEQTRPRAFSFPRANPVSTTNLRKSSCPNPHPSVITVSASTAPQGPAPNLPPPSPPQTLRKRASVGEEVEVEDEEEEEEKERSLFSQWIEECRLAWRKAHQRARLPSITDT